MSLLLLIVTLWLQSTFNTCEITNKNLQTVTIKGEYKFELTTDSMFVFIDNTKFSYLIDSYKLHKSIVEVYVEDGVYYFFTKEGNIDRVIVKPREGNNLTEVYY